MWPKVRTGEVEEQSMYKYPETLAVPELKVIVPGAVIFEIVLPQRIGIGELTEAEGFTVITVEEVLTMEKSDKLYPVGGLMAFTTKYVPS